MPLVEGSAASMPSFRRRMVCGAEEAVLKKAPLPVPVPEGEEGES